jgi:hypothetical protein
MSAKTNTPVGGRVHDRLGRDVKLAPGRFSIMNCRLACESSSPSGYPRRWGPRCGAAAPARELDNADKACASLFSRLAYHTSSNLR